MEAADTPEVKSQKFEEAMEWTMLDKDYNGRTRRVSRGRCLSRCGGVVTTRIRFASCPTGRAMPLRAKPTLRRLRPAGADFAAQMVARRADLLTKSSRKCQHLYEKVTGATNPPPKPSSSGRSGGGGRSCACACACAGCACACAGGGR